MDLNSIKEQINEKKWPPVETWRPELSGTMDLVIEREGQWRHEGQIIQRNSLCQLFASILLFENDEYYLVTPIEKWQIQVACLPFYIVAVDRYFYNEESPLECFDKKTNQQQIPTLVFTDSLGNKIELNDQHPLLMINDIHRLQKTEYESKKIPTIKVRKNLLALLSREVYYKMIEWAMETYVKGDKSNILIESSNHKFILGSVAEND